MGTWRPVFRLLLPRRLIWIYHGFDFRQVEKLTSLRVKTDKSHLRRGF